MKKIALFFALVAFISTQVSAQTVDEIISKYVDAMGGKDKLASLKTVKMTGGMTVQGTDISIVITKTQLTGMRLEMEIMGASNYQVANNTKGYVFMPIRGMAEPAEMSPDEWKSFSSQMDVQGPLFNYKEKGSTVELAGSEKVDGNDAYKLKLTFKNGRVVNYFIDKKTNHIIKTSGKANMQGKEMDVETSFSDYKQNADGYWFAYSITNMQGTIAIDKVETNLPVDEKIYAN